MQILDLMEKMNLTAATPCNLFDPESAYNKFQNALSITCDLYHAKTEILPNIVNNRTTTSVVKKLNAANLNDSCRWLQAEADKLTNSTVNYYIEEGDREGISVESICKTWFSFKTFDATSEAIAQLISDTTITTAQVQAWLNGNLEGETLANRITC